MALNVVDAAFLFSQLDVFQAFHERDTFSSLDRDGGYSQTRARFTLLSTQKMNVFLGCFGVSPRDSPRDSPSCYSYFLFASLSPVIQAAPPLKKTEPLHIA